MNTVEYWLPTGAKNTLRYWRRKVATVAINITADTMEQIRCYQYISATRFIATPTTKKFIIPMTPPSHTNGIVLPTGHTATMEENGRRTTTGHVINTTVTTVTTPITIITNIYFPR